MRIFRYSTQFITKYRRILRRLFYLGLIIAFTFEFGCYFVSTVQAQSILNFTPTQLSFAGTHCYGKSPFFLNKTICDVSVSRSIILQSSQGLSQVKIIPLDLVRADNLAVIPATSISVTDISDIQPNQPQSISVTVDLRDVPSGQFTGNLLINYSGGGQTLPLSLVVKDPWPVPFLVLLIGILLGVGVGIYRASGRERDLVRVQVSRLRTSLQADPEIPAPFRHRIEGYLVQVDLLLDGDQMTEANTASTNANEIWKKWLNNRDDWLALYEYQGLLAKRCQSGGDLAYAIPFQQSLCRAILEAGRDGPDEESPVKLRTKLDTLTQHINTYQKILSSLDYMRNCYRQLQAAGAQKTWKDKIEQWQSRLDMQTTDNLDGALEGDVVHGRENLDQAIDQQAPALNQVKDTIAIPDVFHLSGPPSSREIMQHDIGAEKAVRRLHLFTVTSYLIAIILLSGVGFNELYINKGTFGSVPWGDYFGLLAWGFGTEATRQAITGVLKTWNLPGLPTQ